MELKGPFHHLQFISNVEKPPARTRTACARMTGDINKGDKGHNARFSKVNTDKRPIGVFSSPDSTNESQDYFEKNSICSRRWEEDRSKIFRHKLQECNRLMKMSENNVLLDQKSSNSSSIDKLHGANLSSLNGCVNSQLKQPPVILYSYQNPPLSLPPSGGCRKPSGHSSLPMELRSSMIKTLPPIGIKMEGDKEQQRDGLKMDSANNNASNAEIFQDSNTLTSDGVTSSVSTSKHERSLRRKLSGESVA